MRKSPSCIKLSTDDFVSVWQGIAMHETRQCKCKAPLEYSTASYLLRDMPGMKTGDWLWTTKIDEDRTKDVADRRKDGSEIVHFHYGLRPVEGAAEPRHQLVGKTNDLQQVQPEEAPKEVTGRRGRKSRKTSSLQLTNTRRFKQYFP